MAQTDNKRIAKNTLLLYIRMILTMCISLYTSRVVLNILGVNDFGIYNVVGGIVSLFTFLNGSMSTATQRYLTFEIGTGNINKQKEIFSTCITIHAIVACVVVFLAETIGLWFLYYKMNIPIERNEAAFWVYQFSILTCVVIMMSVPYNASIIAHEKMNVFAFISIFEVCSKLLIVYLLLYFEYDKLIIYAVLMFIIQLIIRMIYSIYCNKNFKETKFQFTLNKKLIKEIFSFAGWNMFGILAGIGLTQGVNIILNIFFGPIVNAARGISVQVQNTITGFCSNFQLALNPQITKSYANRDYNHMYELIFASAKYSFFLLLLISLPFLIETNYLLSLWLNEVPNHTTNFVRIMLCISLINVTADSLLVSCQATGRIKIYQVLVGGTLLLVIPSSYIALNYGFKPESVFIIHFIIATIAQVIRLIITKKLINLKLREYFKQVVLKIFIITPLASITPLLFHWYFEEDLLRVLLVTTTCIISVSLTVFFIGLNHNEKKFIKDTLLNKIKSKKNK